ncbi:uncharacterized protein [Phaenicophaeus curvirostris]|uniref:uncharacterized protein n=1 Tax=Phaenicophaeus curvirostris TaxID=33595 RepID=UPI0037F0D5D1
MKMAGCRWLVLSVRGLLLCILALHLCAQDPLVMAEHNAVTSASVGASNISAVNNTALVATHNTSMGTNNTTSVGANNASMGTTTKNLMAAASNTSVGTHNSSLTCQSFQCSGERCYQDEAHANKTMTCHNETFCELYRFSSTNYTTRCSGACGTEMCRTNSSVSTQHCVLDCCKSPLCLQLNASSYGDLPASTTPPTITTPRPPARNGKVCTAFSCHGEGCFKGKKTLGRCIVGQDFCEMKKTGVNYVAGCSKGCKAAKPVCASGVKTACYQECCRATPKASCLKLDGKVHVNGAGQLAAAPLLKLIACGVVLLLNYRTSASLWG